MQRCPYIHEMRERLLGQPAEALAMEPLTSERPPSGLDTPQHHNNQVGTIVKLNSDGYGSHTSPAHAHQRTPLVPRDLGEDFNCLDSFDEPINPKYPKNAKTSLFIIMSFVYAMLLVVVCVAYVISDVSTHRLPPPYYESFFTYLYGASILFLLYVFCFLLQESSCCNGGKQPKPKPEKKVKKQKPKKEAEKGGKDAKGKEGKEGKDKCGKPSPFQEVLPRKMRDKVRQKLLEQQDVVEIEAPPTPRAQRKRKTSQNDQSHGSFFLRVGAIAFGLGTMIYTGLEFGTFFEVPFDSPCYQILRGVNPLLQMIFTFMQMYFIFMNSRLNIHRFKVLARFGLMHVVATNICVWLRTLVLESLKEITTYHQRRGFTPEDSAILESIRQHTLRNAGTVMGTELNSDSEWLLESAHLPGLPSQQLSQESTSTVLTRAVRTTLETLAAVTISAITTTEPSTTSTTTKHTTTYSTSPTTSFVRRLRKMTTAATTTPSTTTFESITTPESSTTFTSTIAAALSSLASPTEDLRPYSFPKMYADENTYQALPDVMSNDSAVSVESLDRLFPAALTAANSTVINCGRINIMGTIVQDSAPYLYPFIIEYSLIGAAVIYVMWKHIGRNPRYTTEEDLEHRLEVMLSRRAVALAHASHSGRVDCVGASKGLFFGLLLLVGSLICLILFFVLVRHPQLSLLAIYLADVSHCALMALSVIAIIVGFIRVQGLKFRCEEQSDLNDILLRVSAFGLFVYSVFSVISGSLSAFTSEPNLLVMVTGLLAVLQVVLQLLFIADVSRRRVHLPEHDRSKPGRQVVTFLLICNISMFAIYTFEAQKVVANPVQLDFYGFLAWSIIQRVCLPLCIFHRFHSAVTLAEVWKTTYKARLE